MVTWPIPGLDPMPFTDAAAISEAAAEEQHRRKADLAGRFTALGAVSTRLMDAAR
jgi:hypothetical protein